MTAPNQAAPSPTQKGKEAQPEIAALLPCPFCGDSAQLAGFLSSAVVECTQCNAETGACDSAGEAVERWNTRAVAPYEAVPPWEDLVKRLRADARKWPTPFGLNGGNILIAAANEIERLRRELARAALKTPRE